MKRFFFILFAATVGLAAQAQSLFNQPACVRHLQAAMRIDQPAAQARCQCLETTTVGALNDAERRLVLRDPATLTQAEAAQMEIILIKVGRLTDQAAQACQVPAEVLRQPVAP